MYSPAEPRNRPYRLSHLLKGQEGNPVQLLRDGMLDSISGIQLGTELHQRSQVIFSEGFYIPDLSINSFCIMEVRFGTRCRWVSSSCSLLNPSLWGSNCISGLSSKFQYLRFFY